MLVCFFAVVSIANEVNNLWLAFNDHTSYIINIHRQFLYDSLLFSFLNIIIKGLILVVTCIKHCIILRYDFINTISGITLINQWFTKQENNIRVFIVSMFFVIHIHKSIIQFHLKLFHYVILLALNLRLLNCNHLLFEHILKVQLESVAD